jgi:putative transcriptional regulator
MGDKMPLGWHKHLPFSLAALLLPAIFLSAAVPHSNAAALSDPLVGKLLIASPSMGEAIFAHTVILIVEHNEGGALGIVINQPFEEVSIASLLEGIGKKDTGVEGNVRIFAGGPMEPGIGFIVHSTEYHRPETLDIDGRIAMTSNPEVLRDIGHKKGPKKSLIAFGYTGWGPGQLEVELARHDWLTIPEDPTLIFDDDRKQVWDHAMARLGQSL